jgi:hypothetical protein
VSTALVFKTGNLMYKTTHHSNALQIDFGHGLHANRSLDVGLALTQESLWSLLNLGMSAETDSLFKDYFVREFESTELPLLQTLQLNPAIEWIGVPPPPTFLSIDYF